MRRWVFSYYQLKEEGKLSLTFLKKKYFPQLPHHTGHSMHYRGDTTFKAYKLGHLYFLVSTSEADTLSASDKQYWVFLVDNSLKG